jgi:hypothetical protein
MYLCIYQVIFLSFYDIPLPLPYLLTFLDTRTHAHTNMRARNTQYHVDTIYHVIVCTRLNLVYLLSQ